MVRSRRIVANCPLLVGFWRHLLPLIHPAGRSNQRVQRGFTLVEIMIVVAIIGTLAAIAIPNFVSARASAQRNSCISSLRQIQAAKDQWAVFNNKPSGSTVTDTDLFGSAAYITVKPVCPSGGTYSINVVGSPSTCNASTGDHVLTSY